jgi:diguanylate cyclase (GGDEF)-like protein
MNTEQTINRIRSCTSLPTLPAVAMQVLQEVRRDDVSIDRLADLIGRDPALSSKLLRTANSAYYGLPRTISTLSQALVILGIESVKTLVLGFSLVRSLQDGGVSGQTQMDYWRRSSYAAVAGRLLAERLGRPDGEAMFLAGLLADIGIPVLKQIEPAAYDPLLAGLRCWGRRLAGREIDSLGLSHNQAGLMLAEQWHLSGSLQQVIRWHHHPRSADTSSVDACRMAELAGLCAEVFVGLADSRCIRRVYRYASGFGLGVDACNDLLARIAGSAKEMTELVEIDLGAQRSYEEILAEANEALQDMTLQSQFHARRMQAQAETDPLTGLANRRKLEAQLASEFLRAGQFVRPLSVIFLDADLFKNVNDTHGHAVGDQVLAHLGRLFASFARPMDTVGRYGGEEFVFVLPEVPLAAAAELAERIRAAVEHAPLALAAGPLTITVSAGVAGFDGRPGVYRQEGMLVHAADRACYAAKAAGRNGVRVFTPKIRQPDAVVSQPAR